VRRQDAGPTGKSSWDDDLATLVVERARELERGVCRQAGVEAQDVDRLRWSRRAIREARAETAGTTLRSADRTVAS
jgi:hypothetical protein